MKKINQQGNTAVIVLVTVILTALIVGGGVYVWQNSVNKKSRQENVSVANNQVVDSQGTALQRRGDKLEMQQQTGVDENLNINNNRQREDVNSGRNTKQVTNVNSPEKTIIKNYYKLIENKEFKKAYEMKYEPVMSFKEFKKMYADVTNIELYDYYKYDDVNYVTVSYSDTKYSDVQYETEMKIVDRKIKTLKVDKGLIKFGNNVVYIQRATNGSKIILVKNGNSIVVDKMEDDQKISEAPGFFFGMKIVNGSLLYSVGVFEYGGQRVYSLDKQKEILKLDWAFLKFDPKNEIAYTCTGAGLGTGPGGVVYSATDFSVKYELSQDFPGAVQFKEGTKDFIDDCSSEECIMGVGCVYDTEKDVVVFTVNNGDGKKIGEVEYYKNTGKVIKK